MKVGLFIPCYIDQFYPSVGIATLTLLESFGLDVRFPKNQTCCGQPMANSGFERFSKGCDRLFVKNFEQFDYIVAPSGSCVLHIKEHLHHTGKGQSATYIRNNIYELSEFLTDVIKVENLEAKFPHKVVIHQACHGQRGLNLAKMSELVGSYFSKPKKLLNMVQNLELVEPERADECCGFGGTFCVFEEALSVKMGEDRVKDYSRNDVEIITSTDMSCLMHLDGILKRQKSPIKVKHIAEILASR